MRHGWISAAILIAGAGLLSSGMWMSGKAALAQVLMDMAWTQAQTDRVSKPPWPGMDARPLARLNVPSLGETAIVLDTDSGQALAFGPAFVTGTTAFGAPGVSAVAAHKNTHFAFLEDIQIGQKITVDVLSGETLTYRVTGTEILNTEIENFVIPQNATTSQLALITCYPFDQVSFGGPLRYIVRAELSESIMPDIAAAEAFGPVNGFVNSFISPLNSQL